MEVFIVDEYIIKMNINKVMNEVLLVVFSGFEIYVDGNSVFVILVKIDLDNYK